MHFLGDEDDLEYIHCEAFNAFMQMLSWGQKFNIIKLCFKSIFNVVF